MRNTDEGLARGGKRETQMKVPGKVIVFSVMIILILVFASGVAWAGRRHSGTDWADDIADNVESMIDGEIFGTEGQVSTVTEASLRGVFAISELQTADYIYNAITEVYAEDGKTIKYHVAYEGTVTAGIDFDSIKVNINEEDKIITLGLPDVEIQETVVNAGSMEYIFENDKYNDESVFRVAYAACQADLDERAATESALLDMARENAKAVIEALVTPWVEQIDSEYTIDIE